ncbi:17202_t:CDS:2, partial [Acaulospora colombiana]
LLLSSTSMANPSYSPTSPAKNKQNERPGQIHVKKSEPKSNTQSSSFKLGVVLMVSMATGSLVTFGGMRIYRQFFKRIRNSEFGDSRAKGYSPRSSVGDGDNFRLYHTPGFGWKSPLKFRSVPKDLNGKDTIHIRLMAVDAPEEALEWLRDHILNQQVWCQILRRDQYGRIVILSWVSLYFGARKFIIHYRLRQQSRTGWATVYNSINPEYGDLGKEHMLSLEAVAQ